MFKIDPHELEKGMQLTLLFLIFLQANLAGAQTAAQSELKELIEYGYRAGTPALKAASEKAMSLFEEVLQNESSQFHRTETTGKRVYPAVSIIPTTSSGDIGQSVGRWQSLLNGIDFFYVPEVVLPKSTAAFMDPKGSFIGVDHSLILRPKKIASAVVHETYHAYTYKQVLDGTEDLFAGYYTVNSGSFFSPQNQEYYFRFGSLDEIVATALSASIDTHKLLEEKDLSRQEKEDLLGEIYFSLNIVEKLAKQLGEVIPRLKANNSYTTINESLSLGKLTKKVTKLTFMLESFEREVKPGGGGTYMKPIVDGASLVLYLKDKSLEKTDLPLKLERLQEVSATALSLTLEAKKCIYVMIEYPQLEKSDLSCLKAKAPKIFEALEAQKSKAYPLSKFVPGLK